MRGARSTTWRRRPVTTPPSRPLPTRRCRSTQTKTLAIEKVASVPGGTADVTGEVISYTMTVTSAGSNAAIAGVVVDDMFTDDLAPVLDGGFNVGDLDDDGLLDVGRELDLHGEPRRDAGRVRRGPSHREHGDGDRHGCDAG